MRKSCSTNEDDEKRIQILLEDIKRRNNIYILKLYPIVNMNMNVNMATAEDWSVLIFGQRI